MLLEFTSTEKRTIILTTKWKTSNRRLIFLEHFCKQYSLTVSQCSSHTDKTIILWFTLCQQDTCMSLTANKQVVPYTVFANCLGVQFPTKHLGGDGTAMRVKTAVCISLDPVTSNPLCHPISTLLSESESFQSDYQVISTLQTNEDRSQC